MTIQLQARVQGSIADDTTIFWSKDGLPLDLSDYTDWKVEARATSSTGALLWTKTTGITSAEGSADTPNVTIAWDVADLGSLTPGSFDLELTGLSSGGKPRKEKLRISITPELS